MIRQSIAALVIALTLSAVPGPRSDSQGPVVSQQTGATAPPVVELSFSVADSEGHAINNVSASDVSITDGDEPPRPVVALKSESSLPLRLVLLVDNSGSTRKNGDVIHKDLLGLADFAKTSLRAEDRAAVITFAEDIFMDQDFTSETGKLEKAIHSIRDGVGGTALSDALVASTHHLARRTQAEARSVQRAIILITDGEDNNSKTRLSDGIRTIQSSSVPVFGVKTSSHTRNGEEYMRTTTTETGGLLFDSQKPQ